MVEGGPKNSILFRSLYTETVFVKSRPS